MIDVKEGSSAYELPAVMERDGKTYRHREISAYAVRDGDLTVFWDCTGNPGTLATYAIGEVRFVEKYPARTEPRPWRRVVIDVMNWRGTMRSWMLPTRPLNFAPRDRVDVWRVVP
jgi:hypothetical protein